MKNISFSQTISIGISLILCNNNTLLPVLKFLFYLDTPLIGYSIKNDNLLIFR